MNPGNDVARKELPDNINNKFVELYVRESEKTEELINIVEKLTQGNVSPEMIQNIVTIYLRLRALSKDNLLFDGFNRTPQFSLRTLSRSCSMLCMAIKLYGNTGNSKLRSIFDAITSAFGCGLSRTSKKVLNDLFIEIFHYGNDKEIQTYYNSLSGVQFNDLRTIKVKGFLLQLNQTIDEIKDIDDTDYLITGKIEKNLIELLRVVAHSEFPILLEGPTSCGKTAVVHFLGRITGNKVVRINNHQHTDLEEYIGTYCPDQKGKLVFKEGLLVEAMRNGYWLILDELNLAKSEI